MKELPRFRARRREDVLAYISEVLINERQSGITQFRKLIEYPDHHYRALFSPGYFAFSDDQTEPTKSQWNNLKKKLKRHEASAFVFKEHGVADCETGTAMQEKRGAWCYYVDFGFFARREA